MFKTFLGIYFYKHKWNNQQNAVFKGCLLYEGKLQGGSILIHNMQSTRQKMCINECKIIL